MGAAVGAALCVDFGSTFTKAVLVDLGEGRVVATADHPTTIGSDVLDGFDACRAELARQDPRAADAEVMACSSAGGGLRIAVVGNEELVTAEAGRRVALSSGGKVVAVIGVAGRSADDHPWTAELLAAEPDVVLLTGGTDGGNERVIVDAARALAGSGWTGPVVVAGNVAARDAVTPILVGHPHVLADNVVPRIGVLAPESARAAIREMFLAHVIGGKHLSARADFTEMVRGATPDVVLDGVELLARGDGPDRPGAGDVVVVDVGGATTDVHSVVELDPEDAGLSREVVATTPVTRTVEGDLGMRWSATTTYDEAVAAGLVAPDAGLEDAAARRLADPGLLPDGPEETAYDVAIATAAVRLGLRRHAGRSRVVLGPDGRVVERTGKDLRQVHLLVGSGGVLRAGDADTARSVLGSATGVDQDGWQLPEHPDVVVDTEYVLAAAGLLRTRHPDAAHRLVRRLTGVT
ncbi:glutamate mutase L [Nocardioides donggukensis]|uniref:Glutamate mutase L n=1 Tax=Nocardioides donggukensis TaxID=2774019 RepID=A0A927Q3B3_9ACTN|nr:glutamate mutase L [Nocardioides donggukensis]MBD8870436.1 glutamate mutase L [Nocardioides donggukensis]